MKRVVLAFCLGLVAFAGMASGAVVPGREPVMAQTPQPKFNPDPLNTLRQDQMTQQQPIPAGGTVVVQAPPPPPQDKTLPWIWTVLAGIGAAIFGKNSFFPAKAPPSDVTPQVTVDTSHPDVRTEIEQAILRLAKSGVLQPAVQAGLSMIPVAGGALSTLEPQIKGWIISAINARLGTPGADAPQTTDPKFVLPDNLVHQIGSMIEQQIAAALGKAKA